MTRRPVRPGRAAAGGSNSFKTAIGIGLMVFVAIAVISIGGYAAYMSATKRPVDRTTGCPTTHYDSITAVMIDLTDPISKAQEQRLLHELDLIRHKIPKYGRLEIYLINQAAGKSTEPLFAACSPGSGTDISSSLYANPALAQQVWQRQFGDKVAKALADALKADPSKTSPLFEAIQFTAVKAFSTPIAQASKNKRLVVVSDMLHNTPEVNFFQGVPRFSQFKQRQYYNAIKPQLHDADVDVMFLVRMTANNVQRPPLYQFWVEFFEDGKGFLRDWTIIQ